MFEICVKKYEDHRHIMGERAIKCHLFSELHSREN